MIIQVKFANTNNQIAARFSATSQRISANFGAVQPVTEYIGGEEYTGDYVVTPKVTEQTMPTKDKVLVDDMIIKSIPFFNVSNTSGGNTVYIGNEV